MIDELGVKIVKTFAGLRSKTYSYLIDDSSKDKKDKKHKKVCHKQLSEATSLDNETKYLEKK